MRTVRPLTMLALFLSALTGCLTPIEVFRNPQSGGIKQAAFELECKESELQVTDLGNGETMGVTGCGKKAVYKRLNGSTWVNNTGGDDANAAPKK